MVRGDSGGILAAGPGAGRLGRDRPRGLEQGRKWRRKRRELSQNRVFDYWLADSTHSDFWWFGVRFEGEYEVSRNGISGADSDTGPIFHVDEGTGVFGSYAADGFRLYAEKGEDGSMKVTAYESWRSSPETAP